MIARDRQHITMRILFGVNNEITCFGNGINCWLSAFSGLAKADKLDDIKQAGVVRIAILIVTHRLVLSIHKPKIGRL